MTVTDKPSLLGRTRPSLVGDTNGSVLGENRDMRTTSPFPKDFRSQSPPVPFASTFSLPSGETPVRYVLIGEPFQWPMTLFFILSVQPLGKGHDVEEHPPTSGERSWPEVDASSTKSL